MKKTIVAFILILTTSQQLIGMDPKATLGRWVQTAYDKWDPTAVLAEVDTTGVSLDVSECMTQGHRLDRLIRYRIEQNETEELCDDLTTIVTNRYPLGNEARHMAISYLSNERPRTQRRTVINRVIATLDLLNPEQIMEDLERGHDQYDENLTAIESRVNRVLEHLVEEHDGHNLMALVDILADRKGQPNKEIAPSKRILQRVYGFLREEEKKSTARKNTLIEVFDANRNDSDVEEDRPSRESAPEKQKGKSKLKNPSKGVAQEKQAKEDNNTSGSSHQEDEAEGSEALAEHGSGSGQGDDSAQQEVPGNKSGSGHQKDAEAEEGEAAEEGGTEQQAEQPEGSAQKPATTGNKKKKKRGKK